MWTNKNLVHSRDFDDNCHEPTITEKWHSHIVKQSRHREAFLGDEGYGAANVLFALETAQSDQMWLESFRDAAEQFTRFAETRRQQFARIDLLIRNVSSLEQRLNQLSIIPPLNVTITTLAPKPLFLVRDLPVTITYTGDDFTATFFDAGISTTGDTDEEAVSNLKDLLAETYELLSGLPLQKLGKVPRQQLAVLQTVIKPSNE